MGAFLALLSAVSYGISDYLGGLLSRRGSFARVALLGQLGGLVSLLLVALLTSAGPPHVADLVWGGISGVGTGRAMVLSSLYPAVPVLLGVLVLREKLSGAQRFGLAGAAGRPARWPAAPPEPQLASGT